MKTKITINAGKANLIAFIYLIPVTMIVFFPFYLLFGKEPLKNGLTQFSQTFFYALPIIIVLHEFLHGITWSFFCKNGFKSIRFGIIWKYVTPYAHCKEELPIKSYRMGTLMPFFILGLVPVTISYILKNGFLLTLGFINIISAGGDLIMLWLLRKVPENQKILDHPNEVGCYIIDA